MKWLMKSAASAPGAGPNRKGSGGGSGGASMTREGVAEELAAALACAVKGVFCTFVAVSSPFAGGAIEDGGSRWTLMCLQTDEQSLKNVLFAFAS